MFIVTTIYETRKQILRAKRAVYEVKVRHRVTVVTSTTVCKDRYKTHKGFQLISNNIGTKIVGSGAVGVGNGVGEQHWV